LDACRSTVDGDSKLYLKIALKLLLILNVCQLHVKYNLQVNIAQDSNPAVSISVLVQRSRTVDFFFVRIFIATVCMFVRV
jgi:hypothetical protein